MLALVGATYEPDENGNLHIPVAAVSEAVSHGFIAVPVEEV
jgi:hypothetical protein